MRLFLVYTSLIPGEVSCNPNEIWLEEQTTQNDLTYFMFHINHNGDSFCVKLNLIDPYGNIVDQIIETGYGEFDGGE